MMDIQLDLGCGKNKLERFIGVDIEPCVHPDIICDLNKIPYPFKANSVQYIHASQFIEHLRINLVDFLSECYRILAPNGFLELHFPNMFSLKARVLYLLGRIEFYPGWHPYHTQLVHPTSILRLMRHIGFDASRLHKRFPTFPCSYLLSGSIWIRGRKRP